MAEMVVENVVKNSRESPTDEKRKTAAARRSSAPPDTAPCDEKAVFRRTTTMHMSGRMGRVLVFQKVVESPFCGAACCFRQRALPLRDRPGGPSASASRRGTKRGWKERTHESFLANSACNGRPPEEFAYEAKYRSRPKLVQKMGSSAMWLAFVVAPQGYGKTMLAFKYANVVSNFANTFWVNLPKPVLSARP